MNFFDAHCPLAAYHSFNRASLSWLLAKNRFALADKSYPPAHASCKTSRDRCFFGQPYAQCVRTHMCRSSSHPSAPPLGVRAVACNTFEGHTRCMCFRCTACASNSYKTSNPEPAPARRRCFTQVLPNPWHGVRIVNAQNILPMPPAMPGICFECSLLFCWNIIFFFVCHVGMLG